MRMLAYLVGAALAPFLVCFMGSWLLALAARKYGRDPYAQASGYRYRFTGHDDALRKRTEKRRDDANAIRKHAVRLEASGRDLRWGPRDIHRLGGGQ